MVILLASTFVHFVFFSGFLDIHVYRAGGRALLSGIGLYSADFPELVPGMPLPFTYPPFSALLFVPLTLVPWHLAKVIMTLFSVLGLLATTVIFARRTWPNRGYAATVALAVAAVWFIFEPVKSTISFGQVNLILMAMVVVDCLRYRLRWPRGILVGVAAAVKLTPAVFVLFFLVRRQYRAALWSLAAFLACGVLALILVPSDSITYWFQALIDPARIGGLEYAFNQSFQGVLSRLLPEGWVRTSIWAFLVLLAMALAGVSAYRARSVGNDGIALLAIAVGGLLASPVSWSHHWVWVVPAVVILLGFSSSIGVRGRCLGMLLGAVFVVGVHQYLPSGNLAELDWSWWQHIIGASYVLVGLGLLGWLAARPCSHRADNHSEPPDGKLFDVLDWRISLGRCERATDRAR
ncbi:glycosyltransferase 87 family protein [Amycolatopsis aidingensis]|uniref:glycosyltransferase 87 family protein n=1 Tax=Amycolatopsis aidingensis TaxID=2842453 RepID=UPI001C0E2F48|nr:glycosyltransferase 87 family protein [Amycolatopsis aidingensis]